jgi:hypothetical protein
MTSTSTVVHSVTANTKSGQGWMETRKHTVKKNYYKYNWKLGENTDPAYGLEKLGCGGM